MKVGFTGTQTGMTNQQYGTVSALMTRMHAEEGHHGDCKGADCQFNRICIDLDIPIVVHPPINPAKRGFCAAKNLVHRPKKEYLQRNKDIVDECDILIACPKGEKEELRSGTWSTIRYARKRGIKTVVVYPSGASEYLVDLYNYIGDLKC